jgi:hypothetical protein
MKIARHISQFGTLNWQGRSASRATLTDNHEWCPVSGMRVTTAGLDDLVDLKARAKQLRLRLDGLSHTPLCQTCGHEIASKG